MPDKEKYKELTACPISIGEKWLDSFLVTYPVSYRYNGGIVIDGKRYEGYKVPPPQVPEGYTLKSIGVGLQMNAQPPYATAYLEPGDKAVTKSSLKLLLKRHNNNKG